MKKKQSVIVQGIIRGFYFEILLFIIYFISFELDCVISSMLISKNVTRLPLCFEIWFVLIALTLYFCLLFFLPCMIGGISYVFINRKKEKSNLLLDITIHSLIYITGLLIVIIVTRIKIEFESYDAIVYGLILLVTIIFNLVVQKKKNNNIYLSS